MLSFIIQPTSREMKNTNLTEMQVDKTRNLDSFIYYFAFNELVVFLYWTRNSVKNLSLHFGLIDARISSSDKDLSRYLSLIIISIINFLIFFSGSGQIVWNGSRMSCYRFVSSSLCPHSSLFNHSISLWIIFICFQN